MSLRAVRQKCLCGGRRVEGTKVRLCPKNNSVYFFRKYGRRRFLFFVFLYLNGVALKELIKQKHGLSSFIWTWIGFYKGLVTKFNK